MSEKSGPTLDEQAFGFSMKDVELVSAGNGVTNIKFKNAEHKVPSAYDVAAAHTTLEANGAVDKFGHTVGKTEDEIATGTRFGGSGGQGTFGVGIAHNPHSRTAYTIERSGKDDDGVAKRVHKSPYATGGRVYNFGGEVEFAPQHQERAKELIRSLGKKQMARENMSLRRDQMRKAKETLGRAGVNIPKPSK